MSINKLEYANVADPKLRVKPQDHPGQRMPPDVANFAHWASRQTENYLNWQIVNLKVSPDTLHDAPVLWISGSEALNLADEDVTKLARVRRGGAADPRERRRGSQTFAKSFVALWSSSLPSGSSARCRPTT